MADYWVFQSEQLVATKFAIFGVIHAVLFLAVLEGGIRQGRMMILLLPADFLVRLFPGLFSRIAISILGGSAIALLSSGLGGGGHILTMMIANAGFLTLWYVECAILLARGFFTRLFGDELPYEITLFVSFIVMVNAGYFTLMFMLSILRAPTI